MFSADLGGAAPASAPATNDPPFQKVALLLHGDGTNGAQNNTFVDSSSNNFTITRTGNVAQGTFSPFSLAEGQWSNYFDGSGDYLTVPANTGFDFGSSNSTVEAWVYLTRQTNSSTQGIISKGASGSTGSDCWSVEVNTSGYLRCVYGNGGVALIVDSALFQINSWVHVAMVCSSSTVTLYKNGVSVGSATASASISAGGPVTIGSQWYQPSDTIRQLQGYISNSRVIKGTAVYTSNFTPSTTPLTAITNTSLLTCQSNRFIDNSSNNFTITPTGDTKVTAFSPFTPSAAYSASTNGGSGYFDGSGDYLEYAASSAFAIGTNDFTIEAFVYPMGKSTNYPRIMNGGLAEWATTDSWALLDRHNDANTKFGFAAVGIAGNTLFLQSSSVVKDYQWYHIAVTRSGTTFRLFINGVLEASYTSSAPLTTSATVGGYIQHSPADSQAKSYISNARIVKGTAVYTSNFTPPTSPLTAISGTSLLLNCTNAGIIDNSGKNDIETVGNAQISTSVKKYGTGSMYFDGSGDYLALPANQDFAMGTGDFTIECWAYAASGGTNNGVWLLGNSYGINTTYQLAIAFVLPNIFVNANGTSAFTSGVTISTGNWYHLALVRSSNTTKLYVDGVSRITFASDSTNYTNTYLTVGGYYSTDYLLNGYIDDLRITKGQALYTTNFTPPAQALPSV